MDKFKIEIVTLTTGDTLYRKPCPHGINYNPTHSDAPIIRAVGSILCRECEYFVKIKDNTVWCE